MHQHRNYIHETVLKRETVESIAPCENLIKSLQKEGSHELLIVDATLGGAGHAEWLVKYFNEKRFFENWKIILIGIDRDAFAIQASQAKFSVLNSQISNFNFHLYQENFSCVKDILKNDFSGKKVHGLYADFGVSSPQLDDWDRGFSFLKEDPVDMRMDKRQSITAQDILLTASEGELTQLFFDYGEEPKAKKLAKFIVMDRKLGNLPLESTKELADYFKKILAYPPNSRSHPATRAFQALRIAVNKELESIEQLLRDIPDIVHNFGKAAFISFHSLEDRLVKRAMRNWQKGQNAFESDKKHTHTRLPLHIQLYLEENEKKGFGKENPRGGIVPSEEESRGNPRARSARLRCFEFERQDAE